ncbi:MAG: ferrochelatase [Proteobacteria bacterium]|nr:ferrochelatase [Pseudomonadota bacterium]
MKLIGTPDYAHGTAAKIGVLLVNLGTPEAPTAKAVRPYLRRFLGDARVVETPRLLWWFILNGIILPLRPSRTAAAYAKIWQKEGSPLLLISQQQQQALQQQLSTHCGDNTIDVALAMSYSKPSIRTALQQLQQQQCRYLLVLPLYPQYASSTIGSVFTDVTAELARWRFVPHLRFISGYCDDPRYINALAAQIADYRRQHGSADKLIFSFHGTPLKMLTDGDPYHCLCYKTARLTAEKLQLSADQWQVTFQSRFGKAVWLQPYTDKTLQQLPQQGVKSVQMVCPAFAADCLETLEEIAEENREIFIHAGGTAYDYIPALNAGSMHINFLRDLTLDAIGDWEGALKRDRANLNTQQQTYGTLRNGTDFYNPS